MNGSTEIPPPAPPVEQTFSPPPIQSTPPTPIQQKPKKYQLPSNVKVSLLTFGLASALVLAFLPNLDKTKSSPPFSLFLLSGLAAVILTSLLFLVLSKLKLGFGKSALVLALGYNSVIAIIKVTMSPYALYKSNKKEQFTTSAGDPNSAVFYILVAASILILYILVFRLVYMYFLRRAARRDNPQSAKTGYLKTKKPRNVLFITLAVFAFLALGGFVILIPLIFLSSSITYLGYVFASLALPLFVALVLAIFLAYRGFAAVEKQVIVTGNSTLLASFFWLGVSLIVLYHIMWIVFMLALVHLWPFNTYSPK